MSDLLEKLQVDIGMRYAGWEGRSRAFEDLDLFERKLGNVRNAHLSLGGAVKGVGNLGIGIGAASLGIGLLDTGQAIATGQAQAQLQAGYNLSKRQLTEYTDFV